MTPRSPPRCDDWCVVLVLAGVLFNLFVNCLIVITSVRLFLYSLMNEWPNVCLSIPLPTAEQNIFRDVLNSYVYFATG